MKHDPVNHSPHYTQGKIEVLYFIFDQDLPYLDGIFIDITTSGLFLMITDK